MTLYIIGFSRAGKSTLARKLAKLWQIPLLDTDIIFAAESGQSIEDFTQARGWQAFRDKESQILWKLGSLYPRPPFANRISRVVACGGGIVENADNRNFLRAQKCLWLHCPWQELEKRLKAKPSAICTGKSTAAIKALYECRIPLYLEVISK